MMAGTIRLFEKTADGLLIEVAPDKAEARRTGRRVSSVNLTIDVLWTAEEEAVRDGEETADQERRRQIAQKSAADAAERANQRAKVVSKLEALGITADDIKVALS
jgi:hypothetical protein